MNAEALPPSPCLNCGVCCFSQLDTFVRVSGDDWTRLGDAVEKLAHFVGHRVYMKMCGGHCAALEVQTGLSGEPVYFCTIYERRPEICRALARGSPQCDAERHLKADRRPMVLTR